MKMTKMRRNHLIPLLAGALFVTASAAQAAVHKVYPGESIQEAIEFHIEGLRDQGGAIPRPTSTAQVVEVSAA